MVATIRVNKVIIESTCTMIAVILTMIPSNTHGTVIDASHPCSALIFDCRSLLQHFEEAFINHTHHKMNHCANLLGKEGNSFNDPLVLHSYHPSHILYKLLVDA